MNWNRVNRLKVITVLIALFSLCMVSGLAFAQSPDEYFFEQGKEALEHQDLSGAYYSFEDALSINPDHQGANLFYALTRILMISKSTNFNALLTRTGMPTVGRDIFNWTADFPRDATGNIKPLATSPTGKEWQDFLKGKDVLLQINGALDNLSNVQMGYNTPFKWIVENGLGYYSTNKKFIDITKSWMPNEWAGYKLLIDGTEYTIAGNTPIEITITAGSPGLPSTPRTFIYEIFGNVEIDYGDVLVLKGSLYMAKAMILALTSYDLNIDIDAIVTLYNSAKLDIQRNIINAKTNFLNLLTTQQLSEAKDALREALNVFTEAIDFITKETDPQEDDVILINPEDVQPYLDLLADLNNSLDKATLIRKIGLDINLGEFFDYPKNLRGYLPIFVGSSYMKRGSFPDPTFGGILPSYLDQDGITHRDMTREELEKRLENHIRDSNPITPLVLYDNFLASRIDTNKWRGGELVREIIKTGDYVYDDFSGPHIDNKKWRQGDWVKEVRGGKLFIKHANSNPIMATTFPYTTWNELIFPDPNSVNSIQADVAILENTVTIKGYTRARLGGEWFNDGTGTGTPEDRTGDIWAEISLRGDANGLYATWGVSKYTNPSGTTWDDLGGTRFITPITFGATYPLYIGYDSGANQFTFRIGNQVRIFPDPNKPNERLPAWDGNAARPFKAVSTRVQIDDSASSGYISATFDNVYKNDSLYDNFSLPIIDSTKWTPYDDFLREISGGKFRSKVRSSVESTSVVQSTLDVEIPTTIKAFQAKVTPLVYQNPQGLDQYQMAGISVVGYNDGSGTGAPGDRTGDVFGNLRIGGKGVKPTAEWEIVRYKDSQTPEIIARGGFNTSISLGITYTLFVGWDGTQFTFKFNNKEEKPPLPVPVVRRMNVPYAGLGTRIFPKGTKEGTIEALFDDVTVIVGSDYKLLFKHASSSPSVPTSSPYTTWNQLSFYDPNSVDSILADVSVVDNVITDRASTRARLEGRFYNDTYGDGAAGNGYEGDIWAEIDIRWTSTGFRAWYDVGRYSTSDGSTLSDLGSGYFNTAITPGVTYPSYIGYDSGTNQFTFKIGDEVRTFSPPGTRAGNAKKPWKSLTTRVQIDNPAASGYISATFDNVIAINASGTVVLSDDFSSPTIDETKWTAYESVREISGGKFRSKVRSSSATTSSVVSRLEFLCPSEINAIQTKVTPLTTCQNDQNANLRARIIGYFYNDGAPGGGYIGDVGAQVRIRIRRPGLDPSAEWYVWKNTNINGTTYTDLAGGAFNTPISLGKTYTLFLGWDGIQLTFKIDNEVAYYVPETGVHPPNNPWRSMETQIIYNPGDPTGKEATMEALFDDVMVSGPVVSVSPKSYDFGKVIAPTISPAQTFTLSNNGSTSIGINSIDLVGGDASMFNIVSTTCPGLSSTLPPKGKCNLVSSFQPTSPGEKSAAIRFSLNTRDNPAIFMPLKGTGVLETISPPTSLGGPISGTTGTTYTFTTGGSSSSLGVVGHSIQYLFDWDDGTNSGWLPVGTTSAKKIWTSSGTYRVKAMARCATHKAVVSDWSSEKRVDITFPIHPTSPLYEHFNVDSLYAPKSPPAFEWNVDVGQTFTGYEIQFSPDYRFKLIPVKVKSSTTTVAITPPTWQTVLAIPGKSGGLVYWRVVGTRSKTEIATSEIAFIVVDLPQAVKINTPLDGATVPSGTPPTFNFDSNCNIKFRLEFSPINNFSDPKKVIVFTYAIANPVTQPIVNWTLACTQWDAVSNLVGSGSYFRIKAWDVINRETVSEVRSFIIQSSLIGTWDITGTVSVTVTIPGYGSETDVSDFYDEFTFNPNGIFEMTDMTGTWTQRGSKFTVYLSRSEIEKYFEENLEAVLGTYANVYGVTVSFTGKENCPNDTISGTITFGMNMDIPYYGITGGTVNAVLTFKGTRLSGSQISMLKSAPTKGAKSFFNTVGEELSTKIQALRKVLLR